MSNAAQPLYRTCAAPQGEKHIGDVRNVGGEERSTLWAALLMQMPSPGWDCSMCPRMDKNRLYYLQFIPRLGKTWNRFHFRLLLKPT